MLKSCVESKMAVQKSAKEQKQMGRGGGENGGGGEEVEEGS